MTHVEPSADDVQTFLDELDDCQRQGRGAVVAFFDCTGCLSKYTSDCLLTIVLASNDRANDAV